MSLKDTWKQTGTGLGHAFRDLGKSIVKSVATGVEKADKWANSEDYPKEEKPKTEEAPTEPAKEAEENKD